MNISKFYQGVKYLRFSNNYKCSFILKLKKKQREARADKEETAYTISSQVAQRKRKTLRRSVDQQCSNGSLALVSSSRPIKMSPRFILIVQTLQA